MQLFRPSQLQIISKISGQGVQQTHGPGKRRPCSAIIIHAGPCRSPHRARALTQTRFCFMSDSSNRSYTRARAAKIFRLVHREDRQFWLVFDFTIPKILNPRAGCTARECSMLSAENPPNIRRKGGRERERSRLLPLPPVFDRLRKALVGKTPCAKPLLRADFKRNTVRARADHPRGQSINSAHIHTRVASTVSNLLLHMVSE